jgi:hypothetical protein
MSNKKVEIYGPLFSDYDKPLVPGTVSYNEAQNIIDKTSKSEIPKKYKKSSTLNMIIVNQGGSDVVPNSPKNPINSKIIDVVTTPKKKYKPPASQKKKVKTPHTERAVSLKKDKPKEKVFPLRETEKRKEKISKPLIEGDKTTIAEEVKPERGSRRKTTIMRVENTELDEEYLEATTDSGVEFYRISPIILPSAPSRTPVESKNLPKINLPAMEIPLKRQYFPPGKSQNARPYIKGSVTPIESYRPGELANFNIKTIVKEKLKPSRQGAEEYSHGDLIKFAMLLKISHFRKLKPELAELIMKRVEECEKVGF